MRWGPDVEAEKASIEAAKRKRNDDATKKDREKEPTKDPSRVIPDVSRYRPGERPCFLKGVEGGGSFKPKRRDGKLIPGSMVHCIWDCGGRTVDAWRPGNSDEVCFQNVPTW